MTSRPGVPQRWSAPAVPTIVAGRAQDGRGHQLVPVWFLGGLVALLYVIWCGGLWLGVRLRRGRS